jgi:outer membrane lipoprotein LolB
MARVAAAILILMSLVGCTSRNIRDQASENARFSLPSLSSWQLQGKIGVRSDRGNANLGFVWDQSPDSFEITLTGALGVLVARLTGGTSEAVLALPDGREYRGAGIDNLLEIQLGYRLPVSLLAYWVRGIPDPGFAYEKTAMGFNQQGWQVEFQQYSPSGPRKIQVRQADIRLRLVALEWLY